MKKSMHFLTKNIKLFLTLLIISTSCPSFSQTEHLKKFYPENKLFKRLKIRIVVDSFLVNYPTARTRFYDTSGRLTGEYNYLTDSAKNPYVYKQDKDTLYRLKHKYESPALYSFEKFVFNRSGKITTYIECRDSYSGDSTVFVNFHLFTYNKAGNLAEQSIFRSFNYFEKVKEGMNITTDNLKLIDRYRYKYQKVKSNLMIIAAHWYGNSVDTLIYNSKKQLIRENYFSIKGHIADRSANHVNDIRVFTYKPSSILELTYTTFCLGVENGQCILEQITGDTDKEEAIIDKNGLEKERHSYYFDGTRHLTTRYYYWFHK